MLTLAAAAPALAGAPPDPIHWRVGDGYATTTQKGGIELSWASSGRGFTLGALEVGGHAILAGLYAPAELGAPVARGATLGWATPPDPVHLRIWDNAPALFELGCRAGNPPDPVIPDDACSVAFPEGHVVEVVRSNGKTHEVLVSTIEERGIVPCVRVLVDGPLVVDGLTLTFAGKLTTKLI